MAREWNFISSSIQRASLYNKDKNYHLVPMVLIEIKLTMPLLAAFVYTVRRVPQPDCIQFLVNSPPGSITTSTPA